MNWNKHNYFRDNLLIKSEDWPGEDDFFELLQLWPDKALAFVAPPSFPTTKSPPSGGPGGEKQPGPVVSPGSQRQQQQQQQATDIAQTGGAQRNHEGPNHDGPPVENNQGSAADHNNAAGRGPYEVIQKQQNYSKALNLLIISQISQNTKTYKTT